MSIEKRLLRLESTIGRTKHKGPSRIAVVGVQPGNAKVIGYKCGDVVTLCTDSESEKECLDRCASLVNWGDEKVSMRGFDPIYDH